MSLEKLIPIWQAQPRAKNDRGLIKINKFINSSGGLLFLRTRLLRELNVHYQLRSASAVQPGAQRTCDCILDALIVQRKT